MTVWRVFSRSVLALLLICQTCAAQDFAAFQSEFRKAIARNDAAAIADLTRLPFLFESRPRDRAGFLAIYPTLFTPSVRRCLASARATGESGDEVVSCPPYAFYFDQLKGVWKLREFNADGEDRP